MSVAIDYTGGAFAANKAQGVGTISETLAGYDLASASYDSVSFSVATQDSGPLAIFFKPDGTKMYMLGFNGDKVYQYSLSTAWDLSTTSYDSVSFSIASQDGVGVGLAFKDDGTKMYMIGNSSSTVYQYSLSTAWDVSSASYDSVSFSVSTQESNTRGVTFKSDGTKMYVVGDTENVHAYTLSTAWNLSTASYASELFSVATQDSSLRDVRFNGDGTKMFILGGSNDDVFQYSLSTAWDVSTASYDSVSFSVTSQDTTGYTIFFKADGTKMYLLGTVNDTVYQYTTGGSTLYNIDASSGEYFNHTPTANTTFTFSNAPASGTATGFALAVTGANVAEVYDIANASYDSVSLAVGGVDTTPVSLAFNNDGTKFYFLGNSNRKVYQYSCSTAYDISTATKDTEEISVSTQVAAARGFNFNNDGTKFFVSCFSNDAIYEYHLSTAFDVSTATYSNTSLSITASSNGSHCMSSDGLYLYIIDELDDIDSYTLSTAWDLSTASSSGTKDNLVETTETSPSGIFISSDGTKLFISGYGSDVVTQSSLSTAYDITTASYDSVSFSLASQDATPYGLLFNPDGTKMYIAGLGNDSIYQYTTGSTSAATFSYPSSVDWPSGTAPTGPAIGETDVLVFYTDDGGTTYQGFQAGDAMG